MLKCWNDEILKWWIAEILKYWNAEMMKSFIAEILICQLTEMFQGWNAELLNCRNNEKLNYQMLKRWNAEIRLNGLLKAGMGWSRQELDGICCNKIEWADLCLYLLKTDWFYSPLFIYFTFQNLELICSALNCVAIFLKFMFVNLLTWLKSYKIIIMICLVI